MLNKRRNKTDTYTHRISPYIFSISRDQINKFLNNKQPNSQLHIHFIKSEAIENSGDCEDTVVNSRECRVVLRASNSHTHSANSCLPNENILIEKRSLQLQLSLNTSRSLWKKERHRLRMCLCACKREITKCARKKQLIRMHDSQGK